MKDLNETGRKVIEAIMKRKPSDAGDLALGVEQIIEDLRSNPSQFKEKLDHLEGLFKELAYGEAYALREEATKDEYEYASGVMTGQQSFNFNIPVSGSVPMGAMSGIFAPITTGVQPVQPAQPISPPPITSTGNNPCGETPLDEPEECSLPLGDSYENIKEQLEAREEEKPKKKFKKRWWKVQAK